MRPPLEAHESPSGLETQPLGQLSLTQAPLTQRRRLLVPEHSVCPSTQTAVRTQVAAPSTIWQLSPLWQATVSSLGVPAPVGCTHISMVPGPRQTPVVGTPLQGSLVGSGRASADDPGRASARGAPPSSPGSGPIALGPHAARKTAQSIGRIRVRGGMSGTAPPEQGSRRS